METKKTKKQLWSEVNIENKISTIDDIIFEEKYLINRMLHKLLMNKTKLTIDNTENGVSIKINDGFNNHSGEIWNKDLDKTLKDFKNGFEMFKSKIVKPIKGKSKFGNLCSYKDSFIEFTIENCHINMNEDNFIFEVFYYGGFSLNNHTIISDERLEDTLSLMEFE